jgi:predicted DNA binding protein
VPAAVSVDVNRIGEYDAPPTSARGDLTDREYEAVSAAFAVGYYDVPRSGSLRAVADRLDCAPGTVSEHLRKAERELVRTALETAEA